VIALSFSPDRYRSTSTVTLDGVAISIRMTWSDAGGAWYADVMDADGVELVTGARVSGDSPLLSTTTMVGLPPGRLVVLGPDPYDRTALGRSLGIYYLTAAEIAEALAAE
jgi:hypothetical protein